MKRVIIIVISFFILSTVQAQYPVSDITGIWSDLDFQGYDEAEAHNGYGEYQIFYSEDGVLDYPVIITDGFDAQDNNHIEDIYNYFSVGTDANLLDDLRSMGIDIVILNFPDYILPDDTLVHGGADFIERNAYVLMALLDDIHEQMTGNETFAVIGPSMGGLVTRYALAYMEQNGMDHHTGLWLSFDSPHEGANIPIALQYLVNYMAIESDDPDLISLRDERLNTPAAKQLLLDHYRMHLADGENEQQDYAVQLPVPDTFRDTFVSSLDALGFPQSTRNLAIVNGSDASLMVESPGATIVNTELDLGSGVGLEMELHFTPASGIQDFEVDHLQPTIYGINYGDPYQTYAASPATSHGLDSAPGGTVLFDDFFAGGSGSDIMNQFYEALQVDSFSFVPSLSALGVQSDNWYLAAGSIDLSDTAFDAVYMQGENQPHLTLTPESLTFAYNEILNHFNIGITDAESNLPHLVNNPVENVLVIDPGKETASEMQVRIFSLTGQKIYDKKFAPGGETIYIPAPGTGIYLLRISTGAYDKTVKCIVK